MDDLEKRVQQFNSLELPGQPMAMHMGTSYLVNDLWREVQRLRAVQPSVRRTASACPAGGEHDYPNDYTSPCRKCGRRR